MMKAKTLAQICGGIAAFGFAATLAVGIVKPKTPYLMIPIVPTAVSAGALGAALRKREEELAIIREYHLGKDEARKYGLD